MKYELSKIKVKAKDYYDNLFGMIALRGCCPRGLYKRLRRSSQRRREMAERAVEGIGE